MLPPNTLTMHACDCTESHYPNPSHTPTCSVRLKDTMMHLPIPHAASIAILDASLAGSGRGSRGAGEDWRSGISKPTIDELSVHFYIMQLFKL